MRVIEPRLREQQRPSKKRLQKALPALILVVGVILLVSWLISNLRQQPEPAQKQTVNQNIDSPKKSGKLKTFTGEQFKVLYNNFSYPNTAPINENTPITGNQAADQRIKMIARQRGYQMRSAPVTNAFQDVGGGHMLQQRAAQPWLDLKAAAQKENIYLGLTAALRSAEEQKQIFMGRLAQTGIPVEGVGSGSYDAQISQVLRTTAIPGYSRHHSGYTVDIACENQPSIAFAYTVCFKWLSANNYEKAKTFGWIPSYPEETELQGPDPESWEYVWVGLDAVTE